MTTRLIRRILFLAAICCSAVSCLKGKGFDEEITDNTDLFSASVSPTVIAADGKDAATFDIRFRGTRLTADDVVFYNADDDTVVEMPDMQFTTEEQGVYRFYATYENIAPEVGEEKSYTTDIMEVTATNSVIDLEPNNQKGLTASLSTTVVETGEDREIVTRLSGGIELSHVTFRYTETMPPVLNNLSLKIRPGQYVAIVGPTGCGKSTLLRLLLGFETPQKGAVYYDGRDISRLDLKSLRRKMGVVMQDGKLFRGDIYSNIAVAAPGLSMDEAWEAAEIAGLAEDIRQMPMGMFTMLSEGGAGISGGQRQRLMIARAVTGKPRILMFDEATSALDNITQKHVSEALDALKCTRIVIAHRLSTIRRCDRILYLEGGRIAEDGSYDELMALKGKFASLVERQQLDPGAK